MRGESDLFIPPPGAVFTSAIRPLEELYRMGGRREVSLRGFLLRDSELNEVERKLYPYLFPRVGPYEFRILAPSAAHGLWVPVLLTRDTVRRGKGSLVEVEGRLYRFPPQAGDYRYYVAAERVRAIRIDDLLDRPPLHGRHLLTMVEASLTSDRPEAVAMVLVGSGAYLGRTAGIAMGAFTTDAEGYPQAMDLRRFVSSLNSIFPRPVTGGNAVVRVRGKRYTVRAPAPVSLKSAGWDDASGYLWMREGRGEVEVTTHGVMGRSEIRRALERGTAPGNAARLNITLSDIPYIPTHEEMGVDPNFISEYEYDVLSYVLHAAVKWPDADPCMREIEEMQKKVFHLVEKSYPELKEMAIYGFVLDLGLMRGLGEGVARMYLALKRLDLSPSLIERVTDFFLERISDAFSEEVRYFERTRIPDSFREARVRRMLYEMTAFRPSGWSYEEFHERMETLFGYDDRRCEKVFRELIAKGEILELGKDPYTGKILYRASS